VEYKMTWLVATVTTTVLVLVTAGYIVVALAEGQSQNNSAAAIKQISMMTSRSNFPVAGDLAKSSISAGCGKSKYTDAGNMYLPAPRIVGGQNARPYEFPWQVSVRKKATNGHFCGGSVINDRWILTAAHCIIGKLAQTLTVVVGEHQRSVVQSSVRQVLNVAAVHLHPSYNTVTQQNDIGLIQVDGSILFNDNIQPVCLAEAADLYVGRKCQTSGWGSTEFSVPSLTDILRYVTLNITSNTYCRTALAGIADVLISSDMICATDNSGNIVHDSCQGDSGGPLTVKDSTDGTFRLVGVVSFGVGCASGYPGVYSRVGHFIAWIKNVTNGSYKQISTTATRATTVKLVTTRQTRTTTVTTTRRTTVKPTSGSRLFGCFPGHSTVFNADGPLTMSQLKLGDTILTVDVTSRTLRYDQVIAFLHRDVTETLWSFLEVVTESGRTLMLTRDHLVYSSPGISETNDGEPRMVFASQLKVGDYVYSFSVEKFRINNSTNGRTPSTKITADKVVRTGVRYARGVYAPVTTSGTVVVDGVMASCYATFSSHRLAHAAMLPLRLMAYSTVGETQQIIDESKNGIHWYASTLWWLAEAFLPSALLPFSYS
jgi:secreted trypsin-like serine protease